jgi:hypothetical protein
MMITLFGSLFEISCYSCVFPNSGLAAQTCQITSNLPFPACTISQLLWPWRKASHGIAFHLRVVISLHPLQARKRPGPPSSTTKLALVSRISPFLHRTNFSLSAQTW